MPSAAGELASVRRHRLAVLPLSAIESGARDDYLVDGLTEELISALSRIPGLSVIARTSAMHYKGTGMTVAEIAQELSVGSVLEGSVRRAAKQLRISVRLIDASTEEEIWDATYDRELSDVFQVQQEIGQRVARALRLRLGHAGEKRAWAPAVPAGNSHDLYLQGRFEWNLRTEIGLRHAIERFEQALSKDRTFALAWCGIADAWAQLGWLEYAAPTEAFPKAREAAERALALDDHMAEAHASLGFVAFLYERDWVTAERELRRSIELNPGYPVGHQFLADYLKAMGRWDEALGEMRRALELDP
ncbi:MAG: hypothetical protein L3J91_07185, partial [Thermoplasmata archaeon]|nr:hypothetical protein [Thermoplasmata archaeon]